MVRNNNKKKILECKDCEKIINPGNNIFCPTCCSKRKKDNN